MKVRYGLTLFIVSFFITACGQRGALYLPETPKETAPKISVASQALILK